MVKPVWNNSQRVNHQNFAKKTHPCAKKNIVPRAVLMNSGLVSINTARQNISKTAVSVNTAKQVTIAHSKIKVNATRPMSYLSKTAHLTVKRPIHKNTTFKNSNIDQRVNTVSGKKFNTARPKAVVNAGNPQMDFQDQGVINSGCSRNMTGNMSYLTNYKEIDGGYVAFRGNPKGGKITRKSTIKTARTPQKNGVTEGRNRTLIEDARTMLADFKLPTTFWAETVNTACYVQNRVKAFRVFNSRTRIVEENLHITFSESTPDVVGSGPDWLFDIDALRVRGVLLQ
ncbi:ribonuclease H-like domain-containing protein [Tanacetum coccineum]